MKGQGAVQQTGTDTSDVQELEKASASAGECGDTSACCLAALAGTIPSPVRCRGPPVIWPPVSVSKQQRWQRFRDCQPRAFAFMLVLM